MMTEFHFWVNYPFKDRKCFQGNSKACEDTGFYISIKTNINTIIRVIQYFNYLP